MCPTIDTSPEKAEPVPPGGAGMRQEGDTEGAASTSRRLEPPELAGYALLALLVLLVALRAELTVDGAYPHDAGLHLPAVERLAQAWERGESVLDCWVSEWVLGYPLWRSFWSCSPAREAPSCWAPFSGAAGGAPSPPWRT